MSKFQHLFGSEPEARLYHPHNLADRLRHHFKNLVDSLRGKIPFVLTIFAVAAINGCVAVQPFPTYAKAGETVVLMLGYSDQIDKEGITLEYQDPATSDPAVTIPIGNMRSIFKLYPDKRSGAWRSTAAGTSNYGRAMDVLVLDLPTEMTTGTWDIIVTSSNNYADNSISPNGIRIPIEIIGTGGLPNDFEVHQVSNYGSPPVGPANLQSLEINDVLQIHIQADASDTNYGAAQRYGAVEIKLAGVYTPVPSYIYPVAFAEDIPWNDKSQRNFFFSYDNSNNTGELTLNFVSPGTGLLRSEINAYMTNWDSSSNPTLVSWTYYDLNGDVIPAVPNSPLTPYPFLKKCSTQTGCQCLNYPCTE